MKIGTQGYTVRAYAQNESDLRQTAKKLRDIGFRALQVSAFGPIAPETVREICGENGLEIVVTHTDPARILADTPGVIRDHQALGCRHVGIGMMPEKYRGSLEGVREFLADYDEAARALAAAGMKLHYHNHAFEYGKEGDRCLIDIMREETDPDRWGFILDVYWTQYGGRDPAAEILNFAGRIDVLHLKDAKMAGFDRRFAAIGDGNLDFEAILAAAADAGVGCAMIEQDDCYGRDPFDELALSAKNLLALGCRF